MDSGFLGYDALKRYIAEYFGNPVLYKVGRKACGNKWVFIYVVNITENIASQRYLMATTEMDGLNKLHLSDINWNSFQTKTGYKYQDVPSVFYQIPLQTPLRETINITEADEDGSIYRTDKFPCMYCTYKQVL